MSQHMFTVAELMRPESVCVIGASEDETKFGGRIMRNLLEQGFAGEIVAINPHRTQVLGHAAYPSISAAGRPVDLVIVAVPRDSAVGVVREAGAAGAKAVIVVSAQFADAGTEAGRAAERELVQAAHLSGTRVIGPNCIGIVSPANAFALCPSPVLPGRPPIKGAVGLVSQSGAMMGTSLDRARAQGIGFSHCFSIGNQADLDLCDFVDYLVDDASTQVICTYVEGFKSPAKLRHVAQRARAASKPWLLVKAGRTQAGSQAAFSHTASIAGDYASLEAVCRESGIVLMDDVEAMIGLGAVLARHPHSRGAGVAVLSPSGGGCAIAVDRLSEAGIELATLSHSTVEALAPMYPAPVSNPIDVGAASDGASMSFTRETHAAVLSDPAVGICLTVLTAAPDIAAFARMACDGARGASKPLLAVVSTGEAGDGARRLFREEGVTFVDSVDTAVRMLAGRSRWLRHQAPVALPSPEPIRLPAAALGAGMLDESSAKELLRSAGIRVNEGAMASTPADAARVAEGIGFPVVLKIVSPDIVHKSDVQGVVLDLRSPAAVREAAQTMLERAQAAVPHARIEGFLVQEQVPSGVELLVGARRDPQFGPMLVVGAGGLLAELLRDVSMASAPVCASRATQMLQELRMSPLLGGFRGRPPVDLAAAAEAISRFSHLAVALADSLEEIEINPLILLERGCVAVDARAKLAETAHGEKA